VVTQHRASDDFTRFARDVTPRLRVALVASFGIDVGEEAASEAIAFAWEHWERVQAKDNPAGYLFRVGQNKARSRMRRRRPVLPAVQEWSEPPWVEPGLPDALAALSQRQRTVVMLLYCFEWSMGRDRKGVGHVQGFRSTARTSWTRTSSPRPGGGIVTDALTTQLRAYGRHIEELMGDVDVPVAPSTPQPVHDGELIHRESLSSGTWLAIVAVLAILALVPIWLLMRPSAEQPADTTIPSPQSATNGWIAFAAQDVSQASGNLPFGDSDIYVVQGDMPARRVVGSESEDLSQVCPAFSPDGRRMVYGEAAGDWDAGFHDASLVVADVDGNARVGATTSFDLEGVKLPPCGIWSPDGRWIAFGASTGPGPADPRFVDQVWIVDTETDEIQRITDLSVTDLDWAPDGSELAIASDGILLYSVASGELRALGDLPGVSRVAWSPDGRGIAYERLQAGSTEVMDLWFVEVAGRQISMLAEGFVALHGVGPVWSPDGMQIAFQRVCREVLPDSGQPCREQHDVVVVTLSDIDRFGPPAAVTTLDVLAEGSSGLTRWRPFSVGWSPQGTELLLIAWADDPVDAIGIVEASPDGSSDAKVLFESAGVSAYSGYPWLTSQSWARQVENR
jgi:Tol biopolymer transport system component